jgi:hypothetical protein
MSIHTCSSYDLIVLLYVHRLCLQQNSKKRANLEGPKVTHQLENNSPNSYPFKLILYWYIPLMYAHKVYKPDFQVATSDMRDLIKCENGPFFKSTCFHILHSYYSNTQQIHMTVISNIYTHYALLYDKLSVPALLISVSNHQGANIVTPPNCMFLHSVFQQRSDVLALTIVHSCLPCVMLVHIMYHLWCFCLIKMYHWAVMWFCPHFGLKNVFFASHTTAIHSNCNHITVIYTTTHDTCMVWI